MSWQSYVDQQLLGTGHVNKAAICGLQGGVWAASNGFQVDNGEITKVIAAFSDPGGVQANGIHIGGTKYVFQSGCTPDDPDILRGKKGANGVIVCKTQQALVVGVYEEPVQAGNCSNVVEKLGDYLRSVGY